MNYGLLWGIVAFDFGLSSIKTSGLLWGIVALYFGLPSRSYGLPWGTVAFGFGLLGFPSTWMLGLVLWAQKGSLGTLGVYSESLYYSSLFLVYLFWATDRGCFGDFVLRLSIMGLMGLFNSGLFWGADMGY